MLLGPNGSGKSTFLQLLSGYVSPTSGEISWTNKGSTVPAAEVYKSVSLATPYLELPEELTLMELLDFHFQFKKSIDGISLQDVVSYSGLPAAADKPIRNYSSGMKQRVRLILAFCSEGELLLLDEPCSNLDRDAVDWYQKLADRFLGDRTVLVCSNRQENEYVFCQRSLDLVQWKS